MKGYSLFKKKKKHRCVIDLEQLDNITNIIKWKKVNRCSVGIDLENTFT